MSILTVDNRIIETIGLASKYPTIKRIGIFGSYVRGENNSNSDIDLIYDYEEEAEKSTDNLLDYVDEIDGIIKRVANVEKIDYVWYKGVLNSENEKFRQNVLNEVVWIYDNQKNSILM